MEEKEKAAKKQEILKWLKTFKRLPTSRFVGLLGMNQERVKELLEELVVEKKVKKDEETTATYWNLI